MSRSGKELHFCLFWGPEECCWLTCQLGLSEPSASSRLRRGGLGGGEQARKRFCSLWELCRSRLWPIFRKDRSPKLSVWASLPICEMWRKSASGRLIMLTDSTSLRFLLSQRPEDGFLYDVVLSGILEDLVEIDLSGTWWIESFCISSFVQQEVVRLKSVMPSTRQKKRNSNLTNDTKFRVKVTFHQDCFLNLFFDHSGFPLILLDYGAGPYLCLSCNSAPDVSIGLHQSD